MNDNLRSRKPDRLAAEVDDTLSHRPVPNGCSSPDDGELFPLSMTLQILGIAVIVFSSMIYLGFTVPVAPRTDLPWWRTGLVYEADWKQLSDVVSEDSLVSTLPSLGFSTVKLSPVQGGLPDNDLLNVIKHIQNKGLKVITTININNDAQTLPHIKTLMTKLLATGVLDGVSLRFESSFSSEDRDLVMNVTSVAKDLVDQLAAIKDEEFVLMMAETLSSSLYGPLLSAGADVVSGPDLCQLTSSRTLSDAVVTALSTRSEDEFGFAWQPCHISGNNAESLHRLHQLLPGPSVVSHHFIPKAGSSADRQTWDTLVGLLQYPSMQWGTSEHVLTNDNVFSFLRWSKGKIHDKFLVMVNMGKAESTDNYVVKLSRFTVPKRGRVVYSTAKHIERDSVIAVEQVTLAPGCMVVVQFSMFGP